ncbi:Ku protein [Bacillus luteolus]|uniref:Non-homologous end joining protein Ku n=1 Tax=Litchfieldia luteola TaxID=682179 RepID=A0ABR9QLV7_9BACI|nr:Ku protein [Cytobacillus luteolus]MBE4909486.1 Ku protein [Cytobacillus luteolus]MBP1940887.1 DNA end-binding protein Ku [Cytobacillus luteolus]
MHTMWKGSISFGLVNIPIKLYSATEDKDIKLRNLHKECSTPIQYEKTCPNCDKEVGNEDIIKGYEYVKGKFVILNDDELRELKDEHEEKAVEIIDFVDLNEIDPIYFNRSYFMGPGENGSKAYALLREALQKSGKIGIAEIAIRSKQHMAIVRVYKNSLVMETIHYPDEVRNVGEVPGVPENVDINEKELDTAIMLIDQLTTTFEPEKYKDEYRTALMELIQSKIENNEGTTSKEGPRTNVVDLMSALQASIEKTKGKPTLAATPKPSAMTGTTTETPTAPAPAKGAKTRTTRKKIGS